MNPLKSLFQWLGHFPIKVRHGLAKGAWWSVYPHSAYWRLGGNDPEVDAVIRKYGTRRGDTCWDIGAHYGIYSIAMSLAVGPEGRVEAFEPDPVSSRRLRWHRWLNSVGHLRIHEVAASEEKGSARLYQYDEFGSTTSHLPFLNETVEGVPYRTITLIGLDAWVEAGRLKKPDFIKLDAEGHGGPALKGLARTLASARPTLLVAIHSREEYNEVTTLLESLDYRFEPVSESGREQLTQKYFGEMVCLPQKQNKKNL